MLFCRKTLTVLAHVPYPGEPPPRVLAQSIERQCHLVPPGRDSMAYIGQLRGSLLKDKVFLVQLVQIRGQDSSFVQGYPDGLVADVEDLCYPRPVPTKAVRGAAEAAGGRFGVLVLLSVHVVRIVERSRLLQSIQKRTRLRICIAFSLFILNKGNCKSIQIRICKKTEAGKY